MFQYVASRILWLVPTLLAMALVTFLVMHATPGSPLDPVAEGANPLSPEAQRNLAQHYGLDRPLPEQFAIFLVNAVRGDFGNSFVYRTRSVREIMADTFPISLLLGSMALALAIGGGLALGILAAVHQNRAWDYVSVTIATSPPPTTTASGVERTAMSPAASYRFRRASSTAFRRPRTARSRRLLAGSHGPILY